MPDVLDDPPTLDEYNARYNMNTRVFGHGLDTSMAVPCPFCAAPNWCTYRIMDMESELSQSHTCAACDRTAKAIFRHTSTVGSTRVNFELVQTGGSEPPPYLPKIRRIEA